MFKTMSAVALSAAVLACAGQASAQIVSPTGNFTVRGNLTISQGLVIRTCDVQLQVMITGGGSGATGQVTGATFAPGQTGCGLALSPRALPWVVTYAGPNAVSITGVAANTFFGFCDNGVLNLAWNNTPPGSGVVTVAPPFPGATTPPSVPYPTATCDVTGLLVVIAGGPVAVL